MLPLVAATGFLIYDSYSRLRANTEADLVATARAIVQTVDTTLTGVEASLQVLAASPAVRARDFASFHALAREALKSLPGNGIVLADASGQQVMSTVVPYGPPLPRSGVPALLNEVIATGKPAISDFYIGATSRQPQVAVGVPIVEDGKVAYVLTMGLLQSGLAAILERQGVPASWLGVILDSHDTIVARTRAPEQFVGKPASQDYRRLTAGKREGIYEALSLEGIPVIGAFSRSPATGWTVALALTRAEFGGKLVQALTIHIGVALAVLVIGIVLAGRVGRHISRSIAALTAPALALGSPRRIDPPTVEVREVDELGKALGRAAALISERERERDEAERKRAEIEARLRQTERLEALGQMAGTVAHDFGNLLTPLLGNLELLGMRVTDPKGQEYLKAALHAAEVAERMIRTLLSFARAAPAELATIDANAALEKMQDLLRQSVSTVVVLSFDLAPDAWPVRVDPALLEMAILNLVINARDAMRGGGKVVVSTRNVTLDRPAEHLVGDYLAVSVADTGSGMPPEVLARAFEPLFTTKGPGKGTGLGLPSVFGFATQAGGTATIATAVGQGTTVTLYLPRSAAERPGRP